MKTLKISSILLICFSLATTSFAQKAKTESLKVSGECGMCKKKIETAAKTAGASFAEWNKDTKILTIKYNSTSTNAAKIQQAVADKGYDTPDFKATEEAYNKLDKCCQYEREAVKEACCNNEKCGKGDSSCAGMDCCKDKDCCKKDVAAKMPARTTGSDGDCCKDGKCTKDGHNGKDCCKQ